MEAPKIRNTKRGPEAIIQAEIIAFLRAKEWYVRETHGNVYQNGFPDLFCCHRKYGHKWVEVKNPEAFSFTAAQLSEFPLLCANGSGVWILVAATESEYNKLFTECNWLFYFMRKHGM